MNTDHIKTELPGPQARAILKRDSKVVSPSYPRDYPFVMSHGEGVEVWDVDGNRFLDFAAGIAVCATGHSHPQVVQAVKAAADEVHMVFPSLHTMGVMFELSKGEKEIVKAFEEQANTIVMDVMTKNVHTCSPDTTLNEVASTFVEEGINRPPVVDEEGHVVGIVARGDIVRVFRVNNSTM